MAGPPEVHNAADAAQVVGAERSVRRREQRWLGALRQVLRTPAGRLVFGEREYGLIARAGVFKSSFHQSGSVVYFNEGRRSFGLELIDALLRADEAEYQRMDEEMRALAQHDARGTEARHTASVTDPTEP